MPFQICGSFTSSAECFYWTPYPYRLQQLFVIAAGVRLRGRFNHWTLTGLNNKFPTHQRQLRHIYVLSKVLLFFFKKSEQSLSLQVWQLFSNLTSQCNFFSGQSGVNCHICFYCKNSHTKLRFFVHY